MATNLMDEPTLTIEGIVAALLRARLATLETVWTLGFADVRRAGRLLTRDRPAAPSRSDLDALMQAFPDTPKDIDDGR